jgi:hypothetical protein
MSSGFWVVLGLVGAAPVGALAQEARQPPGGQAGTAPEAGASLIIVELPEAEAQRPEGEVAEEREEGLGGAGTGGSGAAPQAGAAPGAEAPNEQIFIGTLRSVTGDRLLMVDPDDRVLEFDLNEQTRVSLFGEVPESLQAVEEGTPVRAVTMPGAVRNQVRELLIYGLAPEP